MTSENSLSTDRERAALKRRLLAALADAGLGGMLPPNAVHVTAEGVSLNMDINNARWFTNHIADIADGSTNPAAVLQKTKNAKQDQLALVFQEVHTSPTGYSPARIITKVAA